MEQDFTKARRVALDKLATAIAERQALDRRILELRQVVASLSAVLDSDKAESANSDSISADEIRNIFQAKPGEVLGAADVAEELKRLGYRLDRYQSPLATIGTMLNRLKDKGDIFSTKSASGKRGFQARPVNPVLNLKRRGRNAAFYGEVPNPFGTTLGAMLTEPKKK